MLIDVVKGWANAAEQARVARQVGMGFSPNSGAFVAITIIVGVFEGNLRQFLQPQPTLEGDLSAVQAKCIPGHRKPVVGGSIKATVAIVPLTILAKGEA